MSGYLKGETQELNENETLPEVQQTEKPEVSFCFACGERIPAGDSFCGKCGQPKRSAESLQRVIQALQRQERDAQALEDQHELGDPIAILELEGVDAALAAMIPAYYTGKKAQISKDGAAILQAIYQPYLLRAEELKPRSADGKRVRALGKKLDELEGWLGMSKAYEYYRKLDPAHMQNIAALWSGIGDWAT